MIYNQSHLGRDLDAVAALLRGSIDLERGFIDIKKCAAIANRIEQIASNVNSGSSTGPQGAYSGPLVAQHARHVIGLDSRGPILFLLFLVEHPEKIFSALEISNQIGSSIHSIRVYACLIRKRLKILGLGECVQTVWGSGYVISREAASRVMALLSADADLDQAAA